MVRFVGPKAAVLGIWTKALVPSKVKAVFTIPGALAVAPPAKEPLLVATRSAAEPSPGHQPIMPPGGTEQSAAIEGTDSEKRKANAMSQWTNAGPEGFAWGLQTPRRPVTI